MANNIEFKLYAGGQSGWIEDKISRSNGFIVDRDSNKKSELWLLWDYTPTNKMREMAKSLVIEYKKQKMTGEYKGFK